MSFSIRFATFAIPGACEKFSLKYFLGLGSLKLLVLVVVGNLSDGVLFGEKQSLLSPLFSLCFFIGFCFLESVSLNKV